MLLKAVLNEETFQLTEIEDTTYQTKVNVLFFIR